MENNSKQIILTIMGIAILVIAVVGLSFAFFNYSKQGETNNIITTGSLNFNYVEDSALTLINRFPQTPDEGKQNDKFTFQIIGRAPANANSINYTITAQAGDPQGEKVRMKDSEINVYVTSTGGTVTDPYGSETGGVAGDSKSGFEIATGTITASGEEQTHDYTLTMWVNESVTISDTDPEATYRASDESTGGENVGKTVYSNLYYSLKINVDADDTI